MLNPLVQTIVEEGSKLAGSFLRSWILRPSKSTTALHDSTEQLEPQSTTTLTKISPQPTMKELVPAVKEDAPLRINPSAGSDTDYRWECVLKHLGAAAVLFREAHERAVTDKAVTDGVSEKVMAALSEHAGMDDDVKAMLTNPDAKAAAQRLMDGCRQLRRAAWDCKITVGGGTVDDVSDARIWNDILFKEAYAQVKKHPGQECVLSGM